MTRLQRSLRVALALSWLPFAGVIAVSLATHHLSTAVFMTLAGVLWLVRLCDIFHIFEL